MMITKFGEYITEQKNLGIKFGIKEILALFKDKQVDFYKLFNINKDIINVNDNISDLYDNNDFTDSVDKMDLRKDVMQNSQDSETLLYKKFTLKFFFLLDKQAVQIEEPRYIFLQYFNDKTDKVSDIICVEHEGNINDFYSKLTDTTLEIKKGDKTYVYTSSNAGNNWSLSDPSQSNDDFKEEMDKNEIKKKI